MKQGKLVPTQNVIEADRCIADLQRRPKLEMVGLGLIYGAPGLGKTTYATRAAYRNGWIYIRLESTTTTKTFAQTLLRSVYKCLGYGDLSVHGSSHELFQRAINKLTDHPEAVIIIDEIDYAFNNPKLLGTIRDIVDETLAIVILVGMENAKERLLQINRYYFDRCSQFYQFLPATYHDLATLAGSVMDVTPSEDVVRYIHRISNGNLRQAINIMDSIEDLARKRAIQEVTLKDIEG